MTIALYLGRFQPFHVGHLSVILEACKKYDLVKIAICASQVHDTKINPFTLWERHDMISNTLEALYIMNYECISVPDLNNPEKWKEFVSTVYGPFDVVITNNPDTKAYFESIGHQVAGSPEYHKISATHIRDMIGEENPVWKAFVSTQAANVIENALEWRSRI